MVSSIFLGVLFVAILTVVCAFISSSFDYDNDSENMRDNTIKSQNKDTKDKDLSRKNEEAIKSITKIKKYDYETPQRKNITFGDGQNINPFKINKYVPGELAEKKVEKKLLKMGFYPENVYRNVYIENKDGSYSQIDVVALTNFGIVLFEVKDYSGWIYGNALYDKWTKTFKNGEKYYFYNPIKQNNGHIYSLKNKLKQFGNYNFISVIVFGHQATIKKIDNLPDGIYVMKLDELSKLDEYFNKDMKTQYFKNVDCVRNVLYDGVKNSQNPEIVKKHIKDVSYKNLY